MGYLVIFVGLNSCLVHGSLGTPDVSARPKRHLHRRRTVRRAVSIKILPTVLETSCTTNPQQIEVMEF